MALLEMLLINDSTLAFFQKNEGTTGSTGSIFFQTKMMGTERVIFFFFLRAFSNHFQKLLEKMHLKTSFGAA
jgi:hypothetical protein